MYIYFKKQPIVLLSVRQWHPRIFRASYYNNSDDTALVADLKEKLCGLVSEFGRVCK